jgi:hypothetical protein
MANEIQSPQYPTYNTNPLQMVGEAAAIKSQMNAQQLFQAEFGANQDIGNSLAKNTDAQGNIDFNGVMGDLVKGGNSYTVNKAASLLPEIQQRQANAKIADMQKQQNAKNIIANKMMAHVFTGDHSDDGLHKFAADIMSPDNQQLMDDAGFTQAHVMQDLNAITNPDIPEPVREFHLETAARQMAIQAGNYDLGLGQRTQWTDGQKLYYGVQGMDGSLHQVGDGVDVKLSPTAKISQIPHAQLVRQNPNDPNSPMVWQQGSTSVGSTYDDLGNPRGAGNGGGARSGGGAAQGAPGANDLDITSVGGIPASELNAPQPKGGKIAPPPAGGNVDFNPNSPPIGQEQALVGQAQANQQNYTQNIKEGELGKLTSNLAENITQLSKNGTKSGPIENMMLDWVHTHPIVAEMFNSDGKLSDQQVLQKFLARVDTIGGGGSTDMARQAIQNANPNMANLAKAMQENAQYLKSTGDYMYAKSRAQDKFVSTTDQQSGMGAGLQNQHQFENAWSKNADRMLFQINAIPPAERAAFYKQHGITKQQLQDMAAKAKNLEGMGAFE